MKTKHSNWKKSIRNKAVKTIDKSRNIWKIKFYDSQEKLRKANIQINTYRDLWQQAEKRVSELKEERWERKQKGISFLNSIKENSKQ